MFPDVGDNAAVISLQNGPVVEGDVKVMFESSAVSALTCVLEESSCLTSITFMCSFLIILRVSRKDMKMFHSTSGSILPS